MYKDGIFTVFEIDLDILAVAGMLVDGLNQLYLIQYYAQFKG
jgi:hypothetical protein